MAMISSVDALEKAFANMLAERLASTDCAAVISSLKHSGLLGLRSDFPSELNVVPSGGQVGKSSPVPFDSDQIGIWEKGKDSACFVRRTDLRNEWYFWADLQRIEPKGTKKRVLLIGESAARGYLYIPEFTPATTLESMLKRHFSENGVEVIDLARLGAEFEVGELALSALRLNPDLTIIFSGNNWRLSNLTSTDAISAFTCLRQKDMKSLRRVLDSRLAEKVRSLIERVASVYEQRNVPLLWIVPEVNLGDWRDPITNVSFLRGDARDEWLSCQEIGCASLKAGQIEKACEMAGRMVELDQGVCAASFYLLADCCKGTGDASYRRRCLEAARDAVAWEFSNGMLSSRVISVSQMTLRSETVKFRTSYVVDLPSLFGVYLSGALPDRQLFLDSCHMTSEGIQVSMAAAASSIVSVLKGQQVPWQAFIAESSLPSAKVEGQAAFLAAIHNAHNNQEYEIVLYYCLKALKHAPELSQVMVEFAEVQARGYPLCLSALGNSLIEAPWPAIRNYLFGQPVKRLDKCLVDAISNSLKTYGINAAERLAQARKEEQGVAVRPAELLDLYYASSSVPPQEYLWTMSGSPWRGRHDYYKAYKHVSCFLFVADPAIPICLSLTCRLPTSPARSVQIQINEISQYQVVAEDKWTTWVMLLSPCELVEGINEVKILWPTPVASSEEELKRVADDIQRGLFPEAYSSFGHIHSLRAITQVAFTSTS